MIYITMKQIESEDAAALIANSQGVDQLEELINQSSLKELK
jgi:hypothetical protein